MARPRIFISSTFFDLRQVRADLDRFIKEMGYEPVRNEVGNIPYGKDEGLEEYCYREVNAIDILVAIIGGRYGTSSQHGNYSITQMEIKAALENGKQVNLFIDKNVYAEFQTFLLNKENDSVKYRFVNDARIFKFIEEIEKLPQNNTIHQFETAQDIVTYLKEQWAGLFQRFLQEETRVKEINLIKGLETTAKTLDQLVNYIAEEKKGNEAVIKEILMSNHPAISRLRNLLNVDYRVVFTNIIELDAWLEARSYKGKSEENGFYTWKYITKNPLITKDYMVYVSKSLFDEDLNLKVISNDKWDDNLIYKQEVEKENKALNVIPVDDLPF